VSTACLDLIRYKIVPKGVDSSEYYAKPEFSAEIVKYCATPGLTCSYLIHEAADFRDDQKSRLNSAQGRLSELDATIKTMGDKVSADEKSDQKKLQNEVIQYAANLALVEKVVTQFEAPNCAAMFKLGKQNEYCRESEEAFLKKAEESCIAAPDSCPQIKAEMPLAMRNEFQIHTCADDKVLHTPMCAEELTQRLANIARAEHDQFVSLMVKLGILLLVVLAIAAWIFNTRCGSCKKFFARVRTHEQDLGTNFSGFSTESEETGSIKSDNRTIATIHTDRKYANFTKTTRAIYTCKFCGQRDSKIEKTTHKERAG
jgi:hypothetical protein